MRTIKLSLSEETIQDLDKLASASKVSRSDILRNRVEQVKTSDVKSLSPADYNSIVVEVQRRMRGLIDSRHIEQAVALTFQCLSER